MKGLELIVQLKASKKNSGDGDTETINLKISTYNYLRKLLTVVMLVKYVEESGDAYWVFLRDINEPQDQDHKTFTVHIPKNHKFSKIHWGAITSIVRQITNKKLGAING